MLTIDSTKRPTIEQIKRHRWMKPADFASRFPLAPVQNTTIGGVPPLEPHAQIIRLMGNLGIEATKIRNVSKFL
jgi:hypothetical protein